MMPKAASRSATATSRSTSACCLESCSARSLASKLAILAALPPLRTLRGVGGLSLIELFLTAAYEEPAGEPSPSCTDLWGFGLSDRCGRTGSEQLICCFPLCKDPGGLMHAPALALFCKELADLTESNATKFAEPEGPLFGALFGQGGHVGIGVTSGATSEGPHGDRSEECCDGDGTAAPGATLRCWIEDGTPRSLRLRPLSLAASASRSASCTSSSAAAIFIRANLTRARCASSLFADAVLHCERTSSSTARFPTRAVV